MTDPDQRLNMAAHAIGRAVRRGTQHGHEAGCGRTCINNALDPEQRSELGVDKIITAAIMLGLVDYIPGGRFKPGPVTPRPAWLRDDTAYIEAMQRRTT